MRTPRRLAALAASCCIFMLGACGSPSERGATSAPGAREVRNSSATASITSADITGSQNASSSGLAVGKNARESAPLSCAAELGAARADARVKLCRNVSPATRPPCNTANSCAMIEDEIARGCALLEDGGPPVAGCGPRSASMEAAAAVVKRYYSALGSRDFATARSQWGKAGPPGQTAEQFRAGFERTRSTSVRIGKVRPGGGGAGSVYQEVPVTVDATLNDGTRQRFRGHYSLRRVNGVEGATPEQLRWHIEAAELSAVPVDR